MPTIGAGVVGAECSTAYFYVNKIDIIYFIAAFEALIFGVYPVFLTRASSCQMGTFRRLLQTGSRCLSVRWTMPLREQVGMAKSDFESAGNYLFHDASWAASENDSSDITTDDLFQTTELMFLAHLSMAEDTDRQLRVLNLGRIHLRLLYVAVKKPGKTVGEVLSFLRVTNQNIHRPLGDLVDKGYVEQRTSSTDRRKRELHATRKGEDLFAMIMQVQFDRLRAAYEEAGKSSIREFWKVLWNILDEDDRVWLLRSGKS